MTLNNLSELENLLLDYIPKNVTQKYTNDWGLGRTKRLLELAENPQNKLKVVHIAGTSGKGSTAFLTSQILISQGFKVGLSVSPFLLDFREAFQVSGLLVEAQKAINYFIEFKKFVDQVENLLDENGEVYGRPTYFEVLSSFAYFVFAKENVDYAVVEVGLGGLYDCSNTVTSKNKICVINKIGFDHVEILGNTIDEIAFQKAGIIQKQNEVVVIYQDYPEALDMIKLEAKKKNANLTIIQREDAINKQQNEAVQKFDFKFENLDLKDLQLSMLGEFQVYNCALALAVLNKLSQRDSFVIDEPKLRQKLLDSQFRGRMETLKIKYKNQEHILLLDGAHNDQKMAALIENLKEIYPAQKFDFLVAFSNTKDVDKMLETITTTANHINVSQFTLVKTQVITKQSFFTGEIGKALEKLNFTNYTLLEDIGEALKLSLEAQKSGQILIVTGSLYFLSFIYKELKLL